MTQVGHVFRTQMRVSPEKTVVFFECFPYVCPESVLIKRSHLYINGSELPFSRTIPVLSHDRRGCAEHEVTRQRLLVHLAEEPSDIN
jgi:hypothetical protein